MVYSLQGNRYSLTACPLTKPLPGSESLTLLLQTAHDRILTSAVPGIGSAAHHSDSNGL